MEHAPRIYLDPEPKYHKESAPGFTARLGSPDGPVIVEDCRCTIYEAARVLLARGITGRLEMWDSERTFARMVGDIEDLALWTIIEERKGGLTRRRWRPNPYATDARQHGGECPKTGETTLPGTGPALDPFAAPRSDGGNGP